MKSTSLKWPEEFKHRIVAAADDKAKFVAEAKTAQKAMLKTGAGYDADEVHAYLRNRVAGADPARPKAKPWRS